MTRQRLPDRRPNETIELTLGGRHYAVTLGYDPDEGRPREVFTHGAKVGSELDGLLADACVAVSLLLQHGADPIALAASMGRLGDGRQPASVLGALADLLADADVPSTTTSTPGRTA